MPFTLLDSEKYDGVNFILLAWLLWLHYFVKIETPKMHVNISSSFNVNYETAVKCTKLHWQFHKMFW